MLLLVTLLTAVTAWADTDNSYINGRELLSPNAVYSYEKAEATCTEVGYKQDCWFMPATQQYYSDAACTEEIAESEVVIPALGHNMAHTAAKSATFTTAGTIEYWYCDRCEKYFGDENGDNDLELNDASSLTFSVDGNATDGYSICIPKKGTATLTLDNSVTSFKIYDDGGEGGSTTESNQPGNYSDECDGKLVLLAPDGKQVMLTGQVMTESGDFDYLTVYRGTTDDDENILLEHQYSDDSGTASSIGSLSAASMLLYFHSDGGVNYAGLDLTATLLNGEYVNPVFYVDANGDEQMANNVTIVTSKTTTMGAAGQTKWYSVNGNVSIDSRIELAGTVNLILTDDCRLDANYGMHLPAGNTLNVFTQSTGSGRLGAWCEDNNAAVGGNGGDDETDGENGGVINIYGGKIMCNGLMGGGNGKTKGTATINLSWTNAEDVVFANPYNGTVTLLKDFTDQGGTSYAAGKVNDNEVINYQELLSANAAAYHAQAEATCTEDGYAQDCWFQYATQKYYADEACTQEIAESAVLTPALGHNMTHTEGTAATFTKAGSVEYWYCDRCDSYFCDEEGDSEIYNFDPTDSENPVDLTFGVEVNATDGYYVRMPKYGVATLNIDDNVTKFKIYDDGGADKNYSADCNGRLVLKAPEGKQVMLSGNILATYNLVVYRGTTIDDENYLLGASCDWDNEGHPIATSIGTANATTMLLKFNQSGDCYAGLDLTAELMPEDYNPVYYADANGDVQLADATPVTDEMTTLGQTGETTWYCVNNYVGFNKRIEVAGTVNLILTDGCSLEAHKGIHLPAGNTLNVFAQSKKNGNLCVYSGDDYEAVIGGNGGDDETDGENGGTVNIYGGWISCDGPLGGGLGKTNGTATINLSWTNDGDGVYAKQYNGTVTLLKEFTDEKGHSYAAGAVADNSNINDQRLLSINATEFFEETEGPGSCTEDYYAQDCWFKFATQKYYADEACTQELVTDDVLTPKGHHMTHTGGTAATFTQAGTIEYWYCERCKKYFCDQEGEHEIHDFDPTGLDLTFSVEGNATDGYSVRMPKFGTATLNVDNSVASFKIYDDGGADNNYSDNCNGSLVLKAPDGKRMMLTGNILTECYYDKLSVYRGTTADSDNILLYLLSSDEEDDHNPMTTAIGTYNASEMLLYFRSNGDTNYAGLDLTIQLLSDEYENPIYYVDANGEEQLADATPVTGKTKKMGKAGETTWYSVSGYVEIDDRIELAGIVNLIIADNCDLYANNGMHLTEGNTLNVFTQSTGSGYLRPWSYDDNNNAAIGGNGGDDETDGENGGVINIYGGKFRCYGALGGGIGKTNGTATINLSWTNAEDCVYAESYNGTVTLLKDFANESGYNFAAGEVGDNTDIREINLFSIARVIHHAQAKATCTGNGYAQECWYMPAKHQYYTDEACTQEIDEDAVWTPALGHNMTHTEGTAATFTKAGSLDYWYCDRCDTYFCDEEGEFDMYNFDPSDVAFNVKGDATNGYYVQMPKHGTATLNIDNTVASFKIYDDGGKDVSNPDDDKAGYYSDDCNGRLVLVAPDNKQVSLTGTIASEEGCDYLSVYNGTNTNGSVLLDEKSGDDDAASNIGTIVSSSMLLYFYSDGSITSAGLDLTVTIEDALGVPLLIADNGDKTAVLDGSSNGELNIQSDVQVEEVVVDREFNKGQPSTLMLPFAIDVADDNGPEFYTFSGIAFDDVEHKWRATMIQVAPGNSIAANTPCIVVPNGERLGLFGSQTLNTKTGGSKQTTQGDWIFKGTYTEKTWTADECGNDYGFAATSGTATDGVTDVEAGDFVQIAEGAHIRPMRSYITYTGTTNPWAGAPRHAAANLPQRISVVLKKADGSTTEIGAIENGELKIDNWYTLDGHKLNKKPAKKGMYIHNGYKAIVK